jgi:hypothetical protein
MFEAGLKTIVRCGARHRTMQHINNKVQKAGEKQTGQYHNKVDLIMRHCKSDFDHLCTPMRLLAKIVATVEGGQITIDLVAVVLAIVNKSPKHQVVLEDPCVVYIPYPSQTGCLIQTLTGCAGRDEGQQWNLMLMVTNIPSC